MMDVSRTLVLEKASPSIDVLESRPHLASLKKRFEELPGIKEYFASQEYKPRPINSPGGRCQSKMMNTES